MVKGMLDLMIKSNPEDDLNHSMKSFYYAIIMSLYDPLQHCLGEVAGRR